MRHLLGSTAWLGDSGLGYPESTPADTWEILGQQELLGGMEVSHATGPPSAIKQPLRSSPQMPQGQGGFREQVMRESSKNLDEEDSGARPT